MMLLCPVNNISTKVTNFYKRRSCIGFFALLSTAFSFVTKTQMSCHPSLETNSAEDSENLPNDLPARAEAVGRGLSIRCSSVAF